MKEKHDSGRTLRIAYRVLSAGVCLALIFAMFSFLGAAVLVRIVTERRKDR